MTNTPRTVTLSGCLVTLGAAAVTAHGVWEVARASGVPVSIAWLYPAICDGLALVAYAATTRLPRRSAGRRYAWFVVCLAAGLSGLAQAAFLAGGVTVAPTQVRFGVGAWPAAAAAIAAHLLHLLRGAETTAEVYADVSSSATNATPEAAHFNSDPPPERPATVPAPTDNTTEPKPARKPRTQAKPSTEESPAALRSRRSRLHSRGDHSICLPGRCPERRAVMAA